MYTLSSLARRDVEPFPAGDNATDTLIGGVHFNLTTLRNWNYTLYSNGTLSNGTWGWCILTNPPYTPVSLLQNGSFINDTWCYNAIYPIGARSGIGVGFAALFAVCLVLVLVNLSRHGKLYLPSEKRFYPIGRRWQWYWGILVCATAMVGLFTGVDIDRYYLPSLPVVLNSFFWYLMQMFSMSLVWEAVRHWGSWMERQFIDPNPFVLSQSDKRGKFELLLPLWFYLWVWLNFFMIIPRNWGNIEAQRSAEQVELLAEPSATDARFKAAVFFLLVAWLTILVSLWHSIRHYEPRNRGVMNRMIGGLAYMPFRFVFLLPLALSIVIYQGLAAWNFAWSPLKVGTNLAAMYLGGYLPSLLILVVQISSGFSRQNEDKSLIQQRRERGDAIDREMGIVKKPAWWRHMNGEHANGSMRDRIMRNVAEVGGGRATSRKIEARVATQAREAEASANANGTEDGAMEMNALRRTSSLSHSVQTDGSRLPPYTPVTGKAYDPSNERALRVAAGLLFPSSGLQNAAPATSTTVAVMDGPGQRRDVRQEAPHGPGGDSVGRSKSNDSGASTTVPPQQIKSMLDI